MNSVNLLPINIPEKSFKEKDNIVFDRLKFDRNCDEKKLLTEAVLEMLKINADILNSSVVKNADGLLPKKPAEIEFEWIGKSKTRLPANKSKLSY